jgi:protein LSM14
MAANASGGGGGGPADFIGALISLVSKSDIRYQGLLAQIDPVKATIALEQGE